MHRGQFFHFLVAGPTLKFGPSYSASLGPNTSCLHPSSITRGGSFFGQGRPGRYPSRANDHRSALGLRRPHQLVGEMFSDLLSASPPAEQATTSIALTEFSRREYIFWTRVAATLWGLVYLRQKFAR